MDIYINKFKILSSEGKEYGFLGDYSSNNNIKSSYYYYLVLCI